jgi:hypothetical protein
MKLVLKPNIIQTLRDKEVIQFKIATALNRKFRTVDRWIRENDSMLTSPAVLAIIKQETGLPDNEILEEAEADWAA